MIRNNWQQRLREYLVQGDYEKIVRDLIPGRRLPASWAILLGKEAPTAVERVALLGAMMPRDNPLIGGKPMFMYQNGMYLPEFTNAYIWEIIERAPFTIHGRNIPIQAKVERLAFVYSSILAYVGTKWATQEDEVGVLEFLYIGKVAPKRSSSPVQRGTLPMPDSRAFESSSGIPDLSPFDSPEDLRLSPIPTKQGSFVGDVTEDDDSVWLVAEESPIEGGLSPQLMNEWGLSYDDLSWDQGNQQEEQVKDNRRKSPQGNSPGLPTPSNDYFSNKDD